MSTYNDMNSGRFRDDLYQVNENNRFIKISAHDHICDVNGAPINQKEQGKFKFHFTIDCQDVPKAWDIVSDKLMNHTHAHIAKVIKPEAFSKFADPDSIQAGKQITLYTFDTISPAVYKELLQDIENDLAESGVRPGPQSNADRMIPGGKYTGYRSDKDDGGKYIGSSAIKHLPREERYNPYNQKDPYENFSLRNDLSHKPSISNEQDLLGQTDAEQSVGCAQWAMTSKGDLYLDPRGISQQEVNSMKRMLNALGIKNDDHETGAFGGGKKEVIRVTGEGVAKIKHLQSGLPLNENMKQVTPQVHKNTAPVSAKSAFSAVTNGLSEKLQVGVGNAIKATTQAMKNVFGGG